MSTFVATERSVKQPVHNHVQKKRVDVIAASEQVVGDPHLSSTIAAISASVNRTGPSPSAIAT